MAGVVADRKRTRAPASGREAGRNYAETALGSGMDIERGDSRARHRIHTDYRAASPPPPPSHGSAAATVQKAEVGNAHRDEVSALETTTIARRSHRQVAGLLA